MSSVCQVCAADGVEPRLDVGRHPVASHFAATREARLATWPLVLGQCSRCGTIQLMEPVPHHALVPPYDWLFAREPEEHLDDAVARLMALPGIGRDSVIAGLTSKDDTTLERFRRHGFERVWRVDVAADLGVVNACANIETVQRLTEPERMAQIADQRGAADLLIVRHIVEHAEDLGAFMAGCAALVKPGGYIMLELPDCSTSLRLADYAMVWEEHSLYFVPETFAAVPALGGFEHVTGEVYPLPFENCIVEIARKTGALRRPEIGAAARASVGQLDSYAQAFGTTTAAMRAKLETWRRERGRIALFGAGHLACAFINFHGLADLIDFVADDTPQKQNLWLPGAGLSILPSAQMRDRDITLALLALSISSEERVIERNASFVSQGGTFASVLAASPRSIRSLAI
jgi:hypothetical protein